MKEPITVVKWMNYKDAEAQHSHQIGGLGGFFTEGMRWSDYLARWDESIHGHLEALRRDIIDKQYRFGGDTHQEDMAPVFSDGAAGLFSYRAWGDLMAAIWSTEENKDYHYMAFYMNYCIGDDT